MPAEHEDQEVAEQVGADRAHGDDLGPELGQVHARASRRASGGEPDLLEKQAALARRDVRDRPAGDVDDVHAEADHPAMAAGRRHDPPPAYLCRRAASLTASSSAWSSTRGVPTSSARQ